MKTIVVNSYSNPSRVTLSHNLTGVRSLRLIDFRLALPDFTGGIPTHLYLRCRTAHGIQTRLTYNNTVNSLSIPDDAVPVFFRPVTNPYFNGVSFVPWPVLIGAQIPTTAFCIKDIGDLSSFELELYDQTGNLFPFPATSFVEYVFSADYEEVSYHINPYQQAYPKFISDSLNG